MDRITEKEALKKIAELAGRENVKIDEDSNSIDKEYLKTENAFRAEYEKRLDEMMNRNQEKSITPDEPVNVDADCGELISREQYEFRCKVGVLSEEIKGLLFYKNAKYGSSALKPLHIFNKSDSAIGILTRIDDKLSRIKNEVKISPNDVIDLIGYLYLLLIDMGIEKEYFERLKD